jgi:hypothetical protein
MPILPPGSSEGGSSQVERHECQDARIYSQAEGTARSVRRVGIAACKETTHGLGEKGPHQE